MKTKFTFLTCLILFFTHLNAQQLPQFLSEDFNLTISNTSSATINNTSDDFPANSVESTIDPVLADSLQAALDRAFDAQTPIGLSVAVNLGEGDVWAAASGISSDTDDLGTHHVFPIGSVSKTITSACILSMVDEGLVSLEDSIGTWISGYPEITGSIKVYQLMNHTSGIYNYTNHPGFEPLINNTLTTTYNMTDMLDNFLDTPYFDAGGGWEYSNTNYLLLGLIIESISQQDYHTAVRERVLTPHGFDGIVLLPQEELTGPLADVWQSQPPINVSELVPSLDGVFSSASAAGAYAATPTDISEWARQLYTGTVLGDATDLLDDYLVDIGDDTEYGLGVFVGQIAPEYSLIGHTGGIIYTSLVGYVPEKDVSFAIHTNDATQEVDLFAVFDELLNECVEYEMSVSNEDVAEAIDLNVYPNPADDELFVEFDLAQNQLLQINLYHANGQKIRTINSSTNGIQAITLDVSDLKSGVYFLELQTEKGMLTKSIVVSR